MELDLSSNKKGQILTKKTKKRQYDEIRRKM